MSQIKEAMEKAAVEGEAAFHEAPSSAVPLNPTGINPVEFKVLIMLDPVQGKTDGGIIRTDESQERQQAAATSATLVACGGNAFEDWNGKIPVPGDRVLLNKFSGSPPKAGDFRNLYRLCNDKDICAVLT
jgi:co-chaperonin GroES (HSP10)